MLKENLKFGLRTILKHKTFLGINIVGLSVGMAAVFFISQWVQNELSYDKYHPNADRIYILGWTSKDKTFSWDGSPYRITTKAVADIPELESGTQFRPANTDRLVFNINGNAFTEKNAVYVDDNWFRIFRYDLIDGDYNNLATHDQKLVLTEKMAKKFFPQSAASG